MNDRSLRKQVSKIILPPYNRNKLRQKILSVLLLGSTTLILGISLGLDVLKILFFCDLHVYR